MGDNTSTYDELLAENARLRAENSRLNARDTQQSQEILRLRDDLKQCRQSRAWERGVLGNTSLKPVHKATWFASLDAYQDAARSSGAALVKPGAGAPDTQPQLLRVTRSDIARRAGLSESAVGDALKALKKAGAFEKEVERKWVPKSNVVGEPPVTEPSAEMYIAPTALALQAPRKIEIPSNWGGKRVKRCPDCGGENIWVRVVCECGHILSEKPYNRDDDTSDDTDDIDDTDDTSEITQPLKNSPSGQDDPLGEVQEISGPVPVPTIEYPLDHVAAGRRAARADHERCAHPRHAIRFLPQAQKWRCGHCNEDVPEPPDGQVVVWPVTPKAARTPAAV